MRKQTGFFLAIVMALSVLGYAFSANPSEAAASSKTFEPPGKGDYPPGPLGALVKQGEEIFTNTREAVPGYRGNALTCASCHLDQGRKPYAAPMWGAYPMYPMVDPKTRKTVWLEDRIRMCFRNALNAAPPDKETVQALDAYIFWLSRGAPIGHELKGRGYVTIASPDRETGFFRGPGHLRSPDTLKGFGLYAKSCASCHGRSGQGGLHRSPPLWGPSSYTMKSGFSSVPLLAEFLRRNMPPGEDRQLTDQESLDIAAYVDSQPRPRGKVPPGN